MVRAMASPRLPGRDVACAGSERLEVPRCSLPETRVAASETCRATPEFREYEDRVALELAGALRWQHTTALPIAVEFDAQSSIRRVCVDSDVPHLPWSVRRQLARSHVTLRALPPGPTCLAG
jgi:hypothetical protein